MTLDAMLGGLQLLDMDAEVELFELDTAPLFRSHGVQRTGGEVYRWTAGVIDLRSEGVVPASGTQTAGIVTLDRLLPLAAGRTYQFGADLDPDHPAPAVAVASFAAATIAGGAVVTQVTLSTPLSRAAPAGTPWALAGTNGVTFRGNLYTPMPIEVTGYEVTGQGKMPRPKLRVSNIGGFAAALVISQGELLGATVTRLRTLRAFLDGGPHADPTSFMEPDVYTVDRLSAMGREIVEWELSPALDQQGLRLPRRIMMRDTCDLVYRQYVTDPATGSARFVPGSCPYSGSAYFTAAGVATSSPALDVCGLKLADCVLRFGEGRLPFGSFPGIGVTRS